MTKTYHLRGTSTLPGGKFRSFRHYIEQYGIQQTNVNCKILERAKFSTRCRLKCKIKFISIPEIYR